MRRDLEDLCATPAAARAAAFALENDAAHLIERRGRRDLRTSVQTLDSAEIAWRPDASARAATLARLTAWTRETTSRVDILGVKQPLSVDEGWLPLKAVRTDAETVSVDLSEAINLYRQEDQSVRRDVLE